MMSVQAEKTNKSGLMVLASVLFCLAGAVEMAAWFVSHKTIWVGMGVMFLGVGAMWSAIAAAYRYKESSDKDMRRM
jgi:uncharacterized membrane protein HdeD (DUF308 family)